MNHESVVLYQNDLSDLRNNRRLENRNFKQIHIYIHIVKLVGNEVTILIKQGGKKKALLS